ncbi:sensor histidine kinase [Deinococcus sedimenti]|nr:ATP-binding protein [Deinococcus sedimenti]
MRQPATLRAQHARLAVQVVLLTLALQLLGLSVLAGVLRQAVGPGALNNVRVAAREVVGDQAARPVARLLLPAVGTSAVLATLLALVIATQLAARTARPLTDAAATAARLARGELAARTAAQPVAAGEVQWLREHLDQLGETLERLDRERAFESAAIAHELRTPLAAMQARLHALIDGVYPLTPQELGPLVTQLDLLTYLADNLRTLTLADAGQLRLHREDLPLHALLPDMLAHVQPLAQQQGVTVRLDAGEPAVVTADARYVRMALGNVLDNAVRHAAREVVVSWRGASVEVRDDGPGVSDEDALRIGTRFYRAGSAGARASGGSGLGLAVTQVICAAHGGDLQVLPGAAGGRFVLRLAPPGERPSCTRRLPSQHGKAARAGGRAGLSRRRAGVRVPPRAE